MLPDGKTETAADVVKFASIEELESLSADKIPGNNSGYEITSLSYECVDTIELRALLLDVTATLKSISPASGSNTRTVKFSAEVGPELVSVEYVPGGEMRASHDNMIHVFYPQVERYRNYSDGSRIGPDKFYDYGHPIEGGYSDIRPLVEFNPAIISWEMNLVPFWIGVNVNPEACYYENGWYCYYDRNREKVNINTVVRSNSGVTYYGDDFLPIVPKIEENPSYPKRISMYETFKYDFYGENRYGDINYYSLSAPEPEYVNMCNNVPDVSAKPFPKDEKALSTGWYFGSTNVYTPEDVVYCSRYQDSEYSDDVSICGLERQPVLWFHLQYLVIDGRIIHFADLCDYKYLGRDVSVTHTGDGYRCHLANKFSVYGAKYKLIEDFDVVPVNGEHIEIDYRDYNDIDIIDENNKQSRSGSSKSRSSEPITGYDTGKTVEIDTTLPESVRNISKSRTLNY